jgi:hypothetical protein
LIEVPVSNAIDRALEAAPQFKRHACLRARPLQYHYCN